MSNRGFVSVSVSDKIKYYNVNRFYSTLLLDILKCGIYIEDITRRREVMRSFVKYCFSPRENRIHIFKPPCNFLFIIWTTVFLHKQQCKSGK